MSKSRKDRIDYKFSILLMVYLTYVLLLVKFSAEKGNQLILLQGLSLVAVYCLYRMFNNVKLFYMIKRDLILLIIFYAALFLISAYNLGVLERGLTRFVCMLIHMVFIYTIMMKSSASKIINYVFTFLVISIFVVIIPHYLIVGSLKFGAFYNLVSPDIPTSNTIDGPLIIAFLFLFSAFDLFINKKYTFINIISIVISVFILLVFSRRGFIFSSFIALAVYYLLERFNKKVIVYSSLLLFFVPMFWTLLSVWLADLFKIDFLSSFIARTDTDELISATGRMFAWNNILALFFSFKSSYFFGIYGGPPKSLFLESVEDTYNHAHNTFLQLFLEAGYFVNIIFIGMLISFFIKFIKINTKNVLVKKNYFFLALVFLFSLSGTESVLLNVNFSNFIFCFTIIGFIIFNMKNTAVSRL